MINYFLKKILFTYTLNIHNTTMFLKQASVYTKHLKFCRKESLIKHNHNDSDKETNAKNFKKNGYCTFQTSTSKNIAKKILKSIKDEEKNNLNVWDKSNGQYLLGDIFIKFPSIAKLFNNEIKGLITQIYGSNFSVYYGILYKSVNDGEKPSGSQLWHTDGGPGTCINLMYCLSEINDKNGSMKCMSWSNSKTILLNVFKKFYKLNQQAKTKNIDKVVVRRRKSLILNGEISNNFSSCIFQPKSDPGLIYAFKNNCIHSGGYPNKGLERYVCVFHIYPHNKQINFLDYTKKGVAKVGAYPKNPFLL